MGQIGPRPGHRGRKNVAHAVELDDRIANARAGLFSDHGRTLSEVRPRTARGGKPRSTFAGDGPHPPRSTRRGGFLLGAETRLSSARPAPEGSGIACRARGPRATLILSYWRANRKREDPASGPPRLAKRPTTADNAPDREGVSPIFAATTPSSGAALAAPRESGQSPGRKMRWQRRPRRAIRAGVSPPLWGRRVAIAVATRCPEPPDMIHGSMDENTAIETLISGLNPQQRAAVVHGRGPLLIVAGAGTGKTATLVHRVAWLIARGTPAERIMLLTFTRRAAAEMLRRADGVLRRSATPARAVRRAAASGAAPSTPSPPGCCDATARPSACAEGFSIHDRADSEDLMNVVRTGLGLAKTDRRFPKKGTCMAIYSRCVNSRGRSSKTCSRPTSPGAANGTRNSSGCSTPTSTARKPLGVLDYDDLLLFWHALLADPAAGEADPPAVRLRAGRRISGHQLAAGRDPLGLSPDGQGLTVVGDDAQSIYSFRAATVRNILDLPKQYPGIDGARPWSRTTAAPSRSWPRPTRSSAWRRSGTRRTSGPSGPRASGPPWSPARTRTIRPST